MVPTKTSVGWQHQQPPPGLAGIKWRMARSAARYLAPQLRGRLTPRILEALEADGWHVHRVGAAAYVHAPGGEHHLIFGVWPRRVAPPAWATRLGEASDGYRRRADRISLEQRWRQMARDLAGRFSHRLPWYRWPAPAPYSFEDDRPGWADQEAADAAAHNTRVRLDAWYGESSPTISRAMDGDR
jgi:hypothetical protein